MTCERYEINNKSFENGPLHINNSGYYYFTEDIVLDFYNTQEKFWAHQENNNFGFMAGIIVNACDVTIDLCGYSIQQSIRDFCLQRFFALIQLNNMPFIIGKGPILENRTEIIVPRNVIIKNGKFGLTSHQAILGNKNDNLTLCDINVSNFEVTGITLNNVTNLKFHDSIIHSANKNVPVSPFFSGFIFIYRLLMTTKTLTSDNEIKQRIQIILDEIIEILEEFIDIIFQMQSLDELYNLDDKFKFFINNKKLSPCNVQGIKITGSGPSVDEFHKSLNPDKSLNSKNIKINNVIIKNICASVDEELALAYNDKVVHLGAGVKGTFKFLENNDVYTILNLMKLLLNDYPSLNDYLKSDLIDDVVYDAVERIHLHKQLTDEESKVFSILRNVDSMGHINKGVVGARFGSTVELNVKNLKIFNIVNNGKKSGLRFKLIHEYNIPKETYLDHGSNGLKNIVGSYSTGLIGSSIVDSCFKNIYICNIKSVHSEAIGVFVNNKSKNVTINDITIASIKSNEELGDSSVILIDENSKNIIVSKSFYNVNKQASNFRYIFLFFVSIVLMYIISLIPLSTVISKFKLLFLRSKKIV